MADGVVVSTATTGATIAAEDVGGTEYQRVKLVAGDVGVSTPVGATSGVPAASSVGLIVNVKPGVSVSAAVSGTVAIVAGASVSIQQGVSVTAAVSGTVSVAGGSVGVVSTIVTVLGTLLVSGTLSVNTAPTVAGASVTAQVSGTVSITPTAFTVNTAATVAGASVTIQQGASVVAQASGTVSVSGTALVSVVPGVSVSLGNLAAVDVTTATSVSASSTALAVVLKPGATIGTILGTQIVSVVPGVSVVAQVSGTVAMSGTGLVSVVPGVSVSLGGLANVVVTTTATSGVSGPVVWLGVGQTLATLNTVLGTVAVNVVAGGAGGGSVTTAAPSVSASGQVVWMAGGQSTTASPVFVSQVGTAVVTLATGGTVATLLGTVAVNVVAGGAAPGTTAATQSAISAQVVWLAPTQTVSVVSTVATLLGTVAVNVVAGGAAPGTTAATQSAISAQVIWLAPTQTVSVISTVVTVLGTHVVTVVPGVSVSLGGLANVVVTTTATSGVSGPVVWLGVGQTLATVATVGTLLGTVAVNVVAGGAAPGTTAATQSAISAQVIWLAPTQTVSVVSTIVTILGTQVVSVVPGVSVSLGGLANVVVTTTATSGVSGPIVWLGVGQTIATIQTVATILGTQIVSVVPGVSVSLPGVSGVVASSVPATSNAFGLPVWIVGGQTATGVSVIVTGVVADAFNTATQAAATGDIVWLAPTQTLSVVSTVATVLGTVNVNVVAGGAAPGTTAATQSAISAQVIWLAPTQTMSVVSTVATLLGTVNVNMVAGGAGATPIGGYMMAVATTSAMSSSTQVMLMSVYVSTGVTAASSAWTVGSGSALLIHGIGFGWSQAAANMQATFLLMVTNTGATISTVASAYAVVTYTNNAALTTFISTGWQPGAVVGQHSSITTMQFPIVIPGPAVVGMAVAATSSGATVYASINAQIVPTVPFWQPVTGTIAISGGTTAVSIVSVAVTTGLAAAGSSGLVVIPKDFARTNFVLAVSSTVVGSSTVLNMTIWTANTSGVGSTTAWAVPAGQVLRIVAVQWAAQSSVVAIFQQLGIIVGTATASLSVVATVGVAIALGYLPLAASNYNVMGLAVDISAGTTLRPAVLVGSSHTILGAMIQGYLYNG